MLTISPSTAQSAVVEHSICFEGSAIVSLPSQPITAPTIDAGANYTYDSTPISYGTFTKTGGSNGVFTDCEPFADEIAYGLQPFYIKASNTTFTTPGSPTNDVHWYIGVMDDAGNSYLCQVMKYCNTNISTCGAASNPGQTWVLSIYTTTGGGLVYSRAVNFNETFFVQSDGLNLYFRHIQAGVTLTDYSVALPTTTSWRFRVGVGYVGNKINFLQIWKGTYQGTIPLTWSVPDGGTLVTSGNSACFSASTPGTYHVCIDSEFDDPICVEVNVDSLTLGLDSGESCGSCVFDGDIVKFTSNAGLDGVLTVVDEDDNPVGTIIDSLTWQAPTHAVEVTATYTLGLDTATCVVKVIDRVKIFNVEGDVIAGMIPGESFQLVTNYPYPQMVWENLDCANIVSPEGIVTIPARLNDNCFGAIDCYIQGKLVDVESGACPNLTEGDTQIKIPIRVIVDPVFPTPEFGGPTPLKWKPETPDFRVVINDMEGGCDETYIRNKVPTYRWTVSYHGLPNQHINLCDQTPCCDQEEGFIDGYDQSYQSAQRLDDFWNMVYGQYGYFTLKDYRTGETWRKVRFDEKMERDHINWNHIHSRTVKFKWSPCCAGGPAGGTCSHYTIREDNIPPTVPTGLTVTTLSTSSMRISWNASLDNVGVKGYILSRGGEEINVVGELGYIDTHLNSGTSYNYKIKAYDFSNNFSDWSSTVIGTTGSIDTPPSIPTHFTATGHGTEIVLRWDASIDNVAVAGYTISIDNLLRVVVGNVTSYTHTGLGPGEFHSYKIKARDTSGNHSAWSEVLIGHTTMSVYEGTDIVIDGVDDVVDG